MKSKQMYSVLALFLAALLTLSACGAQKVPSGDAENISEALAAEIGEAYFLTFKEQNSELFQELGVTTDGDIGIAAYYGRVGGYELVSLRRGTGTVRVPAVQTVEQIGTLWFTFPSPHPTYLYQDGCFYGIRTAYEEGRITEGELYAIGILIDPDFETRPTPEDVFASIP